MTAEVDVHRHSCECESEVSKGEILNVNVNVNVNGNGNGISKDDTDGSYVFITGSDAMISDDPVESESDLNGSLQNNGSSQHLEVKVGENVPPLGDKVAEESPRLSGGEVVFEGDASRDHQSDEEPKLVKEVAVVDGASRDLGQESEHDSIPTHLDEQVVGDPVCKETPDVLPDCHAHDSPPGNVAEENGSSENGLALPAPGICENASFQVEEKLATDVGNGTVSDKPAVRAQEGVSEPLVTNDLVDTPQENGSCENAESCEKVPINNGESFSTAAENGTIANLDVESGVSLPTEDVSTCAVDDVRPGADAEQLNEKSSETPITCPLEHSKPEIKAESGPVEDTLSNCPANDAISEPNSKLEIESEVVPILDDTLSSSPENDGISEPSSKSEVESVSAAIVDDTLSSFPQNDAILEANSNSEVQSESPPVVDDTPSSCPASNGTSETTSKSESEFESPPTVDDTLSSCPGNDAISEPNSKSEIEFESAPVVDDTLSSCPVNGAISEPNSKSEIEFESAPVADDTPTSFPANDAISEPNSKSEIEFESAPVVDDTPTSCPANDAISELNSKSEIEFESASVVDDTPPSFPANDAISETNSKSEIEFESAPVVDDTLTSCPANDTISEPCSKSEIEFESAPIVADTLSSFPANDAMSEPKTSHDSIGCEEKVSNDAVDVDSGLSNLEVGCPVSLADNNANEASLPAKANADDKPESEEVHSTSSLRSCDIPNDDGNTSESGVLNDSSVEKGRPLNCNLDGVQIESDVKSTCQVVECTDGIDRSEASTSSREVSTTDALEGQNKGSEVEKRPFYFLIRVPRYDDENLKEQIKHAQLHVEEKTRSRDAIRSRIQMKRDTCAEFFNTVEAARSEERAARELFKAKRQEMDTVQVTLNKVKNAISVEDLDSKIRNMEHRMQHETLPLKEEKQFIREIKQMKQLREQITSGLGKQDEIQQALDQKDNIDKRSKVLKKELDQLRDNLFKAEAVTQAAKKKFNEENNMLNELLSQFRAADNIRQEAYAHLQSLRKQQYDKNKYFWRYKDDAKAAYNLALSGDREQLQHFCVNQVETIMELWNENDDFRKEYIRCNNRSTLRRLRTSDGRSLGPDEEPPVIPDIVRAPKNNLATVPSTPEQAKRVTPLESEKPDEKSAMKVVQQKNEIAKTRKPMKPASSEISPAVASGRTEIEDERVEDPKPTKEEEELARKAEELRKEEEAARLREQRRLEEKAKAKEAQERKKRIVEKAQARAAIRAQKEAEEKEKEREKREKKKERKKATRKATNGIGEGESAPEAISETPPSTPEESETREKPVTITKRSQKSLQFTKQSKVKPIPLPLRNRSKRRMQPWMWVLVTIVVIFGLFLLGNGGSPYLKSVLTKYF